MIDENVRSDFPILRNELTYFDNACMSLRPNKVIEAITEYYTDYSACAGRSNHRLAKKVTDEVEHAREIMGKFIGASRSEEIVFTKNTSEGMNLLANSLQLNKGDVVLTSDKEHNSNLVPWLKLKNDGVIHKVIPSKSDNTFDMQAYRELLTTKVKLVSVVHTSNLDGVTFPVKEISVLAKKNGSLVAVDGAQSVPHRRVNVEDMGIDFLSFSGHKMCGPSGTGVFYGRYNLLEKMDSFMVGGDTVVSTTYDGFELLAPPEKFEAGLQDYAGIIGLGAAAEYLESVGLDEIHKHEMELNERLSSSLSDIEGITLIGPEDPGQRSGIYSFYVDGVDAHKIALMLDESNKVMVRSGQHCVHSWFADKGIEGSVRASLYFYNTYGEVEKFVDSLKTIIEVLK